MCTKHNSYMKIYFIGQKGIPAVGGGVENYVDNLAVRLAQHGHDVFVYTRWKYSDRRSKIYKGVNLINLPSLSTKNLDAISHTFLATLHLLFQKVDIIHYHSIGPSSLLWLPKIFKRSTLIVATFQSQCYFHQKWSHFAQIYLRLGEYILCTFADTIIVPSKILQKRCLHLYGKQAVCIPNGVTITPAPKIFDSSLTKWNLKNNAYILAVSRLIRHKGIHYLIKAYQATDTDKKLVIVGDGSYTDAYVRDLKKLAKDNKNIIFTGNQFGSNLRNLYSNAYAFVQSSESEGFSIALLEAMSYGLPIIASDIKENQEVLGRAAFFFKNKQTFDLVKVLHYVLSHPTQAHNQGQKALQLVKKKYDWDKLVNEIEEIYVNAHEIKKNNLIKRKHHFGLSTAINNKL